MRSLLLILAMMVMPVSSFGQVRILFSHQSVGRHVVADPERADPSLRATLPIRAILSDDVALWDHDYYNYSTDIVTPGVYIPGSLLDPSGEIFSTSGFGSHRGSENEDVLLKHLLGESFTDTPDPDGQAFRDSCLSRFDIVMIKPGYRDLHMNTASSISEYQQFLNEVSDWWHATNVANGTDKFLVVMTGSSLRHPGDYAVGTAGWEDTPEGHAEAEADVAAYRELDLWMQNVWVKRHPENKYFSTFEICVNLTGTPSEQYFTKDIYTGTGAGDKSGDHHLNAAGSNDLQDAMAYFINQLAVEFQNDLCPVEDITLRRITLFNPTPNPFNPTTSISFEMKEVGSVRLSVFDISGKLVTTLVNEVREIGRHEVYWNGKNSKGSLVSSGVYFARIESGSFIEKKSMTLLK